MLSNKYLQLVLLNFCIFALGLEVNLSVKDNITWSGSNIIQKTATSIKKITNDIFFAFKLKRSESNQRLKQYAVTYNYFSSISSKDDENLHQISIASRVDNTVGNVSHYLVDVINDLLNEEPANNTEESKHEDLQVYVEHFLKNLEYLKNSHGVNNIGYDMDNQILQLMRSTEHDNVTKEDPGVVDDDNSSDNEFWRPDDNTRRIYNGENTKVKYFPFMASIHIFQNFQCGGSIIKSDLVITAASCLQLAYNNRFFRENPAFLSVRIGSNYYVGGGESIAVLEVYFYPTYDPKTLNNNIALMRLDRRIKFKKGKSRVMKIEYDRNAHRLPMSGIEEGITMIGWGAKGVSNVVRDPWNNRLSFAVLDIYPMRECQDIYSKKYVTQKTFCAGFFSKGSGACSGDVGGPGIVAGVLTGIVSFGSPRCGTPDAPTVFIKVGFYADWIQEIMQQEVATHSRLTTTLAPPTLYTEAAITKTTFVIQPIFDKELFPIPINQAESLPYMPLRSAKKKTKQTFSKTDDLEIEDDNLFKEFLAVMFGSNEVEDYERILDKGKAAKREQVKKIRKTKKITTTPAPAGESELETTVDHGWDDSSDDEKQKLKATRSYQTTAIVEEYNTIEQESNEVPLIEDHDVVAVDTPADGDKLNVDDNLEVNGEILEDDILKLIEGLDITSEKEIDKLVAQISDEPFIQETVEVDYEIPKKKNKLKSSRKDKDTVDSVDMQHENVENDDIFEINDHDTLDDGVSVTGDKDLTLREDKNNNKAMIVDADSIFDLLPKEDMYQLLAQAVNEFTQTGIREHQKN